MPSVSQNPVETPFPSNYSTSIDINKKFKQVKRRLSNPLMNGQTQATLYTLNSMKSGNKKSGYAPLSIPFKRRLQTAAVLWHTVCIPLFASFVMFSLGFPLLWPILFIYIAYNIFDKTASNGMVTRRYSQFFRDLKVWKYYCEYFPITLHKTVELIPTFTKPKDFKENNKFNPLNWIFGGGNSYTNTNNNNGFKKTGPAYIFGIHPHGVISLSGFGAIGTNGAGWSTLFPGIPVCLMTLLNHFRIPFYRDYLLALGITSSGRINSLKILRQGFSLAIVVGGAQESLLAKPDSNDIVLNKRKGFIKLALETGNVGLVPCFCFGENDLYNILEPGENSFGHTFQLWLKKTFGFTIPFFHARGIFNYDFGLLPYRREVNMVIGKPIIVPFLPSPSKAEVDKYHDLYVDGLKKLFHENKSRFKNANGREYKLNIVL